MFIAEPCIGTKDTACVDACPVDCTQSSASVRSSRPSLYPSGHVHVLRKRLISALDKLEARTARGSFPKNRWKG